MQYKTNAGSYVKDVSTGVVINNDQRELAAYIQERERIRQMQSMKKDIDFLKQELRELKILLTKQNER